MAICSVKALNNPMPNKVWGEIIYIFPNFNRPPVEIWEWISIFTAHFMMDASIYPCWLLHVSGTKSHMTAIR